MPIALRRLVPIVPIAVAVYLLLIPPAGTGWTKGRKDPVDTAGPLDIRRAHLDQSGRNLSVRVQTYGSWTARQLSGNPTLAPGSRESYLCLELVQDENRSRSCLTKSTKGRKRLSRLKVGSTGSVMSKRSINARIKRGGNRSFRASFRFREGGMRPGRFGWRAISGWGDPSCAPRPTPPGGPPEDPAPPVPRCTDQAPNSGYVGARIRRPRIVGCTHGGPLVRSHGSTKRKRVALTFDDGPSSYTGRVIEILDQHNAKGTFFVLGQEVSGRQSLLRRALRHGHTIGNHTMHHGILPTASDMRATSSVIRRATGFRPCLFRPPGGAINLAVARGARSAGMTTVVWDVDTRDWTGAGSGTIRSRVTAVRRGSIVLMHDGGGNRSPTIAALPSIISKLKQRGFKLVTATRLLGERAIWRPK